MTASRFTRKDKPTDGGKLRIGDDWNAIRIIALSQSNPLKAIAEFVENSIDAHAKTVTITRGREHGAHYLSIKDDGDGVPRDDEGLPNFKYVATHICDSIKRRLKAEGGGNGLQGEFGIGLLSFWTVGDTLTMTSAGADQRAYQMTMSKGDSRYTVSSRRVLFAEARHRASDQPAARGHPQLERREDPVVFSPRNCATGCANAKVRVTVIDKLARKQYEVEPRAYEGRLLHQIPAVRTPSAMHTPSSTWREPADSCRVALTRAGTRVIEDLASLPGLERAPWSSRYLQGLIDVPFLNLTPGTRSGIIHDERYAASARSAASRSKRIVNGLIEAQQRAEEEQASQQSLRTIQRAFREALLALPPEEYDWFDIQARATQRERTARQAPAEVGPATGEDGDRRSRRRGAQLQPPEAQRQFFDYAGPLFSVVISPASSTMPVNERRRFRALPRDRSRRRVDGGPAVRLGNRRRRAARLDEHGRPGSRVRGARNAGSCAPAGHRSRSARSSCSAEALVTVTDSLEASMNAAIVNARGLPGYTFERAAGELWRSRFDAERNLIVVNSGHRDFVFATQESCAAAALSGAALRQGAGAEELRRHVR